MEQRQRFARYNPVDKSNFYRLLKTEISDYLSASGTDGRASTGMVVKVVFCFGIFMVCYIQFINANNNYFNWLLWCLGLGFASLLAGINIGHDAVHGALFRKKWLNKLASHAFELIGISSYVWSLKHNILHHQYPNVNGVDPDIEAYPLLRFSPNDPLKSWHRYQHLYAPLVYMLFSISLLFVSDWLILRKIRREDIDGKPHPTGTIMWILVWKIVYLLFMIIVPMLLLPFTLIQILGGFLLMHAVLSLFLALVLLPSHLFEQTMYSHKDNQGVIEEDWAIHQLSTTLDFAPESKLMNFIFGGFNTNVVHHLFPKICHYYYIPLTTIVATAARKNNIPYHQVSFQEAVSSHFFLLKKLGTLQNPYG